MTLAVRSLSVVYPDGTEAVKTLSFELGRGESVALIGANGAGKTSLLLALAGVLPFSGTAEAEGIPLGAKPPVGASHRVGMVFQNPDDQLFMPTIFRDVVFGPRNMGLGDEESARRAEETLRELNIAHLRDRSPLKLSGGEKRIASIAAVLAMTPSFLLFDEPTAFLDPRARRGLIGIMKRLGQAKLIATHDFTFALETCERAILLKDGEMFAVGEPEALFFDRAVMEGCGVEEIRR